MARIPRARTLSLVRPVLRRRGADCRRPATAPGASAAQPASVGRGMCRRRARDSHLHLAAAPSRPTAAASISVNHRRHPFLLFACRRRREPLLSYSSSAPSRVCRMIIPVEFQRLRLLQQESEISFIFGNCGGFARCDFAPKVAGERIFPNVSSSQSQ